MYDCEHLAFIPSAYAGVKRGVPYSSPIVFYVQAV